MELKVVYVLYWLYRKIIYLYVFIFFKVNFFIFLYAGIKLEKKWVIKGILMSKRGLFELRSDICYDAIF